MDRGTVGSAQSGRLLVEVRQEGTSAVVTPAGELDHHTADLLREPLEDCLAKGYSRLVVDCSRLEFCDSTGLNVLLGARLKAEAAGWRGASGGHAARGGAGLRDHRGGGGLHRARRARRGPGARRGGVILEGRCVSAGPSGSYTRHTVGPNQWVFSRSRRAGDP